MRGFPAMDTNHTSGTLANPDPGVSAAVFREWNLRASNSGDSVSFEGKNPAGP
jgi:hypothetical protein